MSLSDPKIIWNFSVIFL